MKSEREERKGGEGGRETTRPAPAQEGAPACAGRRAGVSRTERGAGRTLRQKPHLALPGSPGREQPARGPALGAGAARTGWPCTGWRPAPHNTATPLIWASPPKTRTPKGLGCFCYFINGRQTVAALGLPGRGRSRCPAACARAGSPPRLPLLARLAPGSRCLRCPQGLALWVEMTEGRCEKRGRRGGERALPARTGFPGETCY